MKKRTESLRPKATKKRVKSARTKRLGSGADWSQIRNEAECRRAKALRKVLEHKGTGSVARVMTHLRTSSGGGG